MSKFKVAKSTENKDAWSLFTGADLTTEKLYKTRAEATKAGINHQFLNDCLEIVEIHHRNIERK